MTYAELTTIQKIPYEHRAIILIEGGYVAADVNIASLAKRIYETEETINESK